MKKQKLTLEELKIKSFVTNIRSEKRTVNGGGTPFILISISVTLIVTPPDALSSREGPTGAMNPDPTEGGGTGGSGYSFECEPSESDTQSLLETFNCPL